MPHRVLLTILAFVLLLPQGIHASPPSGDPPGGIAGQVVDKLTGAPIEGAVVAVGLPYEEWPAQTTGPNGRVAFPQLAPGPYSSYVSDPSGRYAAAYGAEVITVTAAMTTTAMWRLLPLGPAGAAITRGRVTDAVTGAGLAGIEVDVEEWICEGHWGCFWNTVTNTLTLDAGLYEFVDAPPGGRLYFTDPANVYADQVAKYDNPDPGETVVVDAALVTKASKFGRIRGRVTASVGGPLQKLDIYLLTVGQANYRYVQTDANGVYDQYLDPGAYQIEFTEAYPFEGEFYPDAPTREAAQQITIRAGDVITAGAVLSEMGRISGRITDTAGRPVPGTWLSFERGPEWGQWGAAAEVDADGRYLSQHLPSGVWHVAVHQNDYEYQVYGGGTNIATGKPITVTVEHTVEGIDITLIHLGAIAGWVVDRATGQPVAGVRMSASWGNTTGTTAADGTFVVTGVGTGWHTLWADDPQGRYPRQTYDDGTGSAHAGEIYVTDPNTTTVEMPLDPFGKITGRVTDVWGAPLRGMRVWLNQKGRTRIELTTDLDGRYETSALWNFSPDYVLTFEDPTKRYQPQAESRTVTVKPGGVGVVDAMFDKLGEVAGHVTDARTGQPVSGVRVQIGKQAASTDSHGYFWLGAIPLGPATITFNDPQRRYVALSRPLTVTPNTPMEGVDAALVRVGEGGRVYLPVVVQGGAQ